MIGTLTKVPSNYSRGAVHTWHQVRRHRAVLSMLKGLKGRVLDYGCGYGDLTHAMARTHDVCGVDLDVQRVSFAQAEYPEIEFKTCEPLAVPYADASFGVVASIVVINFVEDAPSLLREIHRLLRPDGHLLLACANVDVIRNWFRRRAGLQNAPTRYIDRSRREVLALLQGAGFTLSRESFFYDSPDESWRNIGDVVYGTVGLGLSLLQVNAAADYLLFVAQKSS